MSKKANPTAIGGFVLVALTVAVGLLLFSGGGLFQERSETFVMFFQGSVNGLKVGAPVMLQGVEVGRVTEVSLRLGDNPELVNIPVYVQFDNALVEAGMNGGGRRTMTAFMEQLVERGFRAQLQIQSLVTGQLQIQLGLFPSYPPIVTGLDKRYPEIPTIASPIEKITQTLGEMPLVEIINQIANITSGLDRIINAKETQNGLLSLTDSMVELRKLMEQAGQGLPGLLAKIEKTVDGADVFVTTADTTLKELTPPAKRAIEQITRTAGFEEGRPGKLADDVETMVLTLTKTLEEAKKVMEHLNGAVDEGSTTRKQLNDLLEEVADAARAVREVADYLERHPESLLRGKGER
ncbi:MAG: MlaD family protein [Lentisphaeria bacterium]|nr:MlaD family protein [Lentisphaeria bacterium]